MIDHLDFLDASIATLSAEICARLVPFEHRPKFVSALCTIARPPEGVATDHLRPPQGHLTSGFPRRLDRPRRYRARPFHGRAEIIHDDGSATWGELKGKVSPETATSASHDRDLTVEFDHSLAPICP